jgi:formamidopyrimidine-DNA glycosylase
VASWPAVPELPEVETIARSFTRDWRGVSIVAVEVKRADVLRLADAGLGSTCTGLSIVRVWRRAKTAVISMSGDWHLLVTPRFTGAVLVRDGGLVSPDAALDVAGSTDGTATSPVDAPGDEYAAIIWRLADGGCFWYRDVRRLGTVTLADEATLAAYEAALGDEPL